MKIISSVQQQRLIEASARTRLGKWLVRRFQEHAELDLSEFRDCLRLDLLESELKEVRRRLPELHYIPMPLKAVEQYLLTDPQSSAARTLKERLSRIQSAELTMTDDSSPVPEDDETQLERSVTLFFSL